MERYTVNVVHEDAAKVTRLLIPLHHDNPVSTLIALATDRLAKRATSLPGSEFELHLWSKEGPIIDGDDLLRDVVRDFEKDTIFVTSTASRSERSRPPPVAPAAASVTDSLDGFKIRVITPALATAHKSILTIPLLHGGVKIPASTTLWDLKLRIANSLGHSLHDSLCPEYHDVCNCGFAKYLQRKYIEKNGSATSSNPTFILVFDEGQVESIPIKAINRSSILDAIHSKLGDKWEDTRLATFYGGTEPQDLEYQSMPIISVCSKTPHVKAEQAREPVKTKRASISSGRKNSFQTTNDSNLSTTETFEPLEGEAGTWNIDLHTSEGYIAVTSTKLSLRDCHLEDLLVDETLNVYCVERNDQDDSTSALGKDAIFGLSPAWELPIQQSRRGMAAFLSSLRMFSGLVSAKKMEEATQDSVLCLFHALTRFPPAVLAVYSLMQGRKPQAPYCAALIQSVLEIVKVIIPPALIHNNGSRFLEGSRLAFGFILAKAQQRKNLENMPFISSIKTLDLTNPEFPQPIRRPVSTSTGLLEEGFFNALQVGGTLHWLTDHSPPKMVSQDRQACRVALLSGGRHREGIVVDMDLVYPALQHEDDVSKFLDGNLKLNLMDLAKLCERQAFSVVEPSGLPRSEAPVLTMDRAAHLAVYLGQAACAEPGKDHIMFRPISGEENVDVSIISQIIAPILQARAKDGTDVFDHFGGGSKRKETKPDEIIMFCVDCSMSMDEPSDFQELVDDEPEPSDSEDQQLDDSGSEASDRYEEESTRGESDESGSDDEEKSDVGSEESASVLSTSLSRAKQHVSQHEAFRDMLAIIHNGGSLKATFASHIVRFLRLLASRELKHRQSEAASTDRWATASRRRQVGGVRDAQLASLEQLGEDLKTHRNAVRDYLLYCASITPTDTQPWRWTTRDEIPEVPKRPGNTTTPLDLSIPKDFVCPISQELFEDPVTATDGFTYDRRSITRWFQIRQSSPSTGLPMPDTTLRSNGVLANNIKRWISGDMLAESTPPIPKKLRRWSARSNVLEIRFQPPAGTVIFSRRVPKNLSGLDLYQFAYQGMSGRYSSFELHHKDKIISPSEKSIDEQGLKHPSEVRVMHALSDTQLREPSSENKISGRVGPAEGLSLIKLYPRYNVEPELFSFWVPKRTTMPYASLIFRHWRFLAERGEGFSGYDVDIWTENRTHGDNTIFGCPEHPWDRMNPSRIPSYGRGILSQEKLWYAPGESRHEAQLDLSHRDIIVHKVRILSHSYQKVMHKRQARNKGKISRLDTAKHIFDAFINRTLAYNLATHIGLIQFGTSTLLSQNITYAIEDFRSSVRKLKADGDTSIWDALALANDRLSEYALDHPKVSKRIVCLSDGRDTCSKKQSWEVCSNLVRNNVTVDSFCIGDEDNEDLRTISHLTGGYKFVPKTLEQAMAICEMEPILSQLDRPLSASQLPRQLVTVVSFSDASPQANPDTVSQDIFPRRKEHPNLGDSFVSIQDASRISNTTSTLSEPGQRSNANNRPARLLAELQSVVSNPHPRYEVFVSETDIGFWKIIMEGPPGSPYEHGTFLLYLHMEDNYPAFPPKGRFCTPILHPNINRHGRICHSIFDRNWTPDTSNVQLLNTVYSLLLTPEFSDPINAMVILNYHWDQLAFEEQVREHIQKHASKSKEAMREEILEL